MPEAWSHWEGHVVNGKFQLTKYLGGSEQSAVFLTKHPEHGSQATTIKLIACNAADAELQLARWREAQKLSHPNLIRIFDFGRCRLSQDGRDLIFAVMEYAEESLAQILSERPLAAQEVREMLAPILDALAYLHVQGFVLGNLKPGNVLATGDHLKLSSDGVGRVGEAASHLEQPGAYDPPEMAGGRRSPAADIWSLGVTLAEVLTQHVPSWSSEDQADPALPQDLPAPFQEIVRGCLRRDAKFRFTVADIAERLHAQPAKPQPRPADAVRPAPSRPLQRTPAPVAGAGKPWLWRTAFPIALAIVGVAGLLAGFSYLRRQSGPQTEAAPVRREQPPQPEQKPAPATKSESHASSKPEPGRKASSAASHVAAVPATPISTSTVPARNEPAALRAEAQPPAGNLTPNSDAPVNDAGLGVVERVLPNVPKSASDTIQGTIRVSVRVNVDPSGGVNAAEMVVPGSSKYFARLSLESAQKWKFIPTSQADARSFLVHFEFRNSGTKGYATR